MKTALQELILSTILTVLIFYTGLSLFPLILFIFPFGFIVLGVRRNLGYSLVSLLLALVFVYILGGLGSVISMGLMSLISIPMILSIKKERSPIEVISISAVFFILLNIILLAIASYVYEGDLFASLENVMVEASNDQIDLIDESVAYLDLDLDIDQLKNESRNLISTILVALPGLIVVYSFVYSLANYYFSSMLIRRSDSNTSMGMFRFFALPKEFNTGVIYSIIAVFILGLIGFQYQEELILNLGIIIMVLYTVQGLSVIADIVGSKSMVLAVILSIFMLISSLSIILAVLGLLEGIFDIRMRWRRGHE